MTPQDFSPPAYPSYAENGPGLPVSNVAARPRHRYWLHGLLFGLTMLTTTLVGASMQLDFDRNLPFDLDHTLDTFRRVLAHPGLLLAGLPYSLTLMTILTAHEFGHFLACMYYRVEASLPYFIPAPTLIGTFGAFIRIRSAIYSKRTLFDVGIAGPLAGFVFLIPALATGLAFSKIIPGIAHQSSIRFGTPALLWLAAKLIFPGVAINDIALHPVARAAWVGLLATALNLLPIGQLDGGHILYSLAPDKHRLISKLAIAVLVPLGIFFWPAWLFWALVLFFLGRRHPLIYDASALGPGRARLGWVALLVFLLSFTLDPISTGGL